MSVLLVFVSQAGLLAGDVPTDPAREPLTVRLVHPERQAAEILRLFEGSPAPHPAAALAAWKRASSEPDRLGKTTEAVISFFNPEMVAEWKVVP